MSRFLPRCFLADDFLVFLSAARIFFFFVTFLVFFPVILLDDFLLTPRRHLRCAILLSRPPSGNWSAADFVNILYPDPLISELIFSLAFLFRLPLDSASRLLTASFNGLLFSTSSITLIPARKASFPTARAPLFRKGSIFLNNPPRKLPIPCPCW